MRRLLVNSLSILLLTVLGSAASAADDDVIRVGSKSFTENFILGEIIAQIAEETGEARVERKLGLGSAAIAHAALLADEIDLYPEYTGTLALAILRDQSVRTVDDIRARLAGSGLTISESFGFNNTSALAVTREFSERLALKTISDLRQHPELTAAFGPGYLDRPDGWPGVSAHYGVSLAGTRIIEHALKYDAITAGEIDLIDVYSTDGKLQKFDLVILEDDLEFFPKYHPVMYVREDFIERFPRTWRRLNEVLVESLDDEQMSRLNALADLDGMSLSNVSATFLQTELEPAGPDRRIWRDVAGHTVDHLFLVVVSVGLAILVGIPLGITAARFKTLGKAALMSVEVVQTIPSLALLVFMIPLFGIGQSPALVALFLYALLPIVRNTYTGMIGLDRQLLEIASVIGLNRWQTLRRIELPLASLSIVAGVKTSAIITVGTATLAAFIGAGGYGTLIVRGLALNDNSIILAGALPAAVMALLIHGAFELLDRVLIPRGLRLSLI
jgi:osmoprotectant transport system permease protein